MSSETALTQKVITTKRNYVAKNVITLTSNIFVLYFHFFFALNFILKTKSLKRKTCKYKSKCKEILVKNSWQRSECITTKHPTAFCFSSSPLRKYIIFTFISWSGQLFDELFIYLRPAPSHSIQNWNNYFGFIVCGSNYL